MENSIKTDTQLKKNTTHDYMEGIDARS